MIWQSYATVQQYFGYIAVVSLIGGGAGVYREILDLSQFVGSLNHIKYTSQWTGCELTTVDSSGQINWRRGESEYGEKLPTCHKALFTVSHIIYLITVGNRTHNFSGDRHQLHNHRSYIRSHFNNYTRNCDLQVYVQPGPVLS